MRSVARSCSSGTPSTRDTAPPTPTGSSTRSTPTRTRACSRCAPARWTTTPGGLPPTAHEDLSKTYGVHKGGPYRYFVNSRITTSYLSLNTIGGPLRKVANRKAINWAIDRPALLRVAGKFAGARTDQILPPNLRGFKQVDLYPLKGANPTRGEAALGRRQLEPDNPVLDDANECRPCPGAPVQPDAGRFRGDPEAAAVCGRDQDGGHQVTG